MRIEDKIYCAVWTWNTEMQAFLVTEWDREEGSPYTEDWHRRTIDDVRRYVRAFVGEGGKIDVFPVTWGEWKDKVEFSELTVLPL